jgi:hypothetical protein
VLARGVDRAEIGWYEALDACLDGGVGKAFLDIDLGSFDGDDDGILVTEDGDEVGDGESVVYGGDFDAGRVGGGGVGGGALQDCDIEAVFDKGVENHGTNVAVSAEEADIFDGHVVGWFGGLMWRDDGTCFTSTGDVMCSCSRYGVTGYPPVLLFVNGWSLYLKGKQ